MTCRISTLLLSSLLILYLVPMWTHSSSLASSATQINSSHAEELKPSLPAEVLPGSSSRTHAHKQRAAEEAGSSGLNEKVISADSAESEHHHTNTAVGGMGAGLPTLSHGKAQLDFKEENLEDATSWWQGEALQPDGRVPDPNSRSPQLFLSESDDSNPVIKVGFYQPDQQYQLEIPPQEVQGGDLTSWTSDFYDYLAPDYSTTESYAVEDQSTPAETEDENIQLIKKAAPVNSQSYDGVSGGDDLVGPPRAVDSSGCVLGFVWRNGTCQSPCDFYSSYCFNGGQCYVVEGIGAFCRCNIQEYMWNKGTRCESVITDFQVMCIVVSCVSVVLLILFMLIVVFSKRLHQLKIENRQLRKRSKSRPQSEQNNDNFSLSTVAEGSQTNNDTAKPEEPVKSPAKEDESLNIQNTLPPKQENNDTTTTTITGTDDPEESGVTIDLELLLPNEAKAHPETSPPLHYNVFLYKLPKSPKISPGRSRQGKVLPQIRPRRGSEPGYSPMSSRTPNPRLGKACTP
ncbi:chondroitin sulfate proteoglycan 5b isoform X2 [Silurus meridionalis]|uniref:Neural chondroitin sulphate proteoglycan cytoplasmic domain-containing protein n=1 Tax=Silurus meridionalis TaxID=175797 RepID=A0A8T0AIR4_SILME|nr:chondroitin sulfate proteoglycan 5b isoform X2 [Silurus meridionalis]KAF7691424.1 hypothetical protein HF521_011721 [Silurus meridionalis]